MESPSAKRQLQTQYQGTTYSDPETASLATLSMRIRKAVSDGYSTNNNYSYQSDFQQQHQAATQSHPQLSYYNDSTPRPIGLFDRFGGLQMLQEAPQLSSSPNSSLGSIKFERPQLPQHLSQPPLLSFGDSTQGSSLAEWEMRGGQCGTATVDSFWSTEKNKRSRSEFEGQPTAKQVADAAAYEKKYGSLSFNEEF
ncbi:hypothetical protein BABINDRAFT_162516 [Babjeviella inositovora NRRL Y-12698]|uniref:Damage-regulated import facilitator 1 n=1 Tax=Babjeviella inositovora NRRL Y-12698 TaxID=984486 RepID=A0A1E3QMI6_9ASCO|nr:uncharacterized protein BABINDRAFT_162516 [Babjeviella inositovora NRRL Y-12698]ODQ78838.1 hypothetical protein BABINDRAFT_162516 [Babjeviella inositovora NRRL Y-12698]